MSNFTEGKCDYCKEECKSVYAFQFNEKWYQGHKRCMTTLENELNTSSFDKEFILDTQEAVDSFTDILENPPKSVKIDRSLTLDKDSLAEIKRIELLRRKINMLSEALFGNKKFSEMNRKEKLDNLYRATEEEFNKFIEDNEQEIVKSARLNSKRNSDGKVVISKEEL